MNTLKGPAGFTVIIPVRNKQNHLARCLISVLQQTFSQIEVLIIDDNSTDGSLQVAKSFQEVDNRVRILERSSPGPGGYAARNLGISQANYDWCAFLDADDEWRNDHLAEAAKLVHHFPEAVVVTSAWLIVNGNRSLNDDFSCQTSSFPLKQLTLEDYLNGPRPIWTGVVRAKTSFLKEVGFFDERWSHGADKQYWSRLFLAASDPILWSPEPTAIYHTDSDNMVTHNLTQTLCPTADFIRYYIHNNFVEGYRAAQLKQFANRSQLLPFIRYVAYGHPVLPYIKKYFFHSDLTVKQKLFIHFFQFMPANLSSFVANKLLRKLTDSN